MANSKISDLPLAGSAAPEDWLELEIAASGLSRKIAKSNLVGATISGGGTIALGGNTLTVGGNSSINGNITGGGTLALGGNTLTVAGPSTINGSLVGNISGGGTIALGGHTLTVPATGTAALLEIVQTLTALKTFSAGISFGETTLNKFLHDPTSWIPTIQGSVSNPTITPAASGEFWIIGNLCFYVYSIPITTISGGSGDVRITLPRPVVGNNVDGLVRLNNVNVPGTPLYYTTLATVGTSYARIVSSDDSTPVTVLQISALLANGGIIGSGFYRV